MQFLALARREQLPHRLAHLRYTRLIHWIQDSLPADCDEELFKFFARAFGNCALVEYALHVAESLWRGAHGSNENKISHRLRERALILFHPS